MTLRLAAAAMAALFLLPAAPAPAAVPAPAAAVEAPAARAGALMRDRRFDEALAVLRPLVRGGAVKANVLFLFGTRSGRGGAETGRFRRRPRRPAGRGDRRLSHHAGRAARPRPRSPRARPRVLPQGRGQTGDAAFRAGAGRQSARRGGAQRQPVPQPDPRAQALEPESRHAAVAPDTNIGAGSDERIIYIDFAGQLLPFRRDQEELTTSGIGVSAWVGGEYQYPLGEPGAGPGASLWRLRAGGNLSRREYRESQFDQMTLTGHVGPRWLIGRDQRGEPAAERAPAVDGIGDRGSSRITISASASRDGTG